MKSFHNDSDVQHRHLDRLALHRQKNEIQVGDRWSDGKGTAIGCTVHCGDSSRYQRELGILPLLAEVEETLFLNVGGAQRAGLPERFLAAMPVGLSGEEQWHVWLRLADKQLQRLRGIVDEVVQSAGNDPKAISLLGRAAVDRVIELCRENPNDATAWNSASNMAYRASQLQDDPAAARAVYAAAHIANAWRDPCAADALVLAAQALTPQKPVAAVVAAPPPVRRVGGSVMNRLLGSLKFVGDEIVAFGNWLFPSNAATIAQADPAIFDQQADDLIAALRAT